MRHKKSIKATQQSHQFNQYFYEVLLFILPDDSEWLLLTVAVYRLILFETFRFLK